MLWLIAIICIVIVVIYWRIFLPLAIFAIVVLGLIIGYLIYNDRKESHEAKRREAALRQRISEAQSRATSEGKKWSVAYRTDPASGTKVARMAYIKSNDGLCYLRVEKRLDGAELTGLDCPGIRISAYDDLGVKFDNIATSDKMDLSYYKDSDSVYIPSYQSDFSGYLAYDKFINRLKTGKAVAIKIPSLDGFWVTFCLQGSTEALDQLGKQQLKTESKITNKPIKSLGQ